jgi:hypothetical protein
MSHSVDSIESQINHMLEKVLEDDDITSYSSNISERLDDFSSITSVFNNVETRANTMKELSTDCLGNLFKSNVLYSNYLISVTEGTLETPSLSFFPKNTPFTPSNQLHLNNIYENINYKQDYTEGLDNKEIFSSHESNNHLSINYKPQVSYSENNDFMVQGRRRHEKRLNTCYNPSTINYNLKLNNSPQMESSKLVRPYFSPQILSNLSKNNCEFYPQKAKEISVTEKKFNSTLSN